jgi:hypothetical protein
VIRLKIYEESGLWWYDLQDETPPQQRFTGGGYHTRSEAYEAVLDDLETMIMRRVPA